MNCEKTVVVGSRVANCNLPVGHKDRHHNCEVPVSWDACQSSGIRQLDGKLLGCNLIAGHRGDHYDATSRRMWASRKRATA